MPDPSKKPRELREEFGHKIIDLIFAEINRTGRERIQAGINRLIDDYSVDLDKLQIDIDISMDVQPMSGNEFVWSDVRPPPVVFGGAD
ncbi:MAG: hypothetical protein AB7G08_28485 [Hyphomicrobiaceae bacterium]